MRAQRWRATRTSTIRIDRGRRQRERASESRSSGKVAHLHFSYAVTWLPQPTSRLRTAPSRDEKQTRGSTTVVSHDKRDGRPTLGGTGTPVHPINSRHMMERRSFGVQRSGRPSTRSAGVGARCSGSGFLEARSPGGCGTLWEVKQATRPRIRHRRARNEGGVHPRRPRRTGYSDPLPVEERSSDAFGSTASGRAFANSPPWRREAAGRGRIKSTTRPPCSDG